MKSHVPNLVSTLIYLFIVIYAGPRFMRNRKPYDLRKYVVVYNAVMVIFSTFLFYEVRAG